MTALVKTEETDNQVTYDVGILQWKPYSVLFALKMAVDTAIGALKIFQLVVSGTLYPFWDSTWRSRS